MAHLKALYFNVHWSAAWVSFSSALAFCTVFASLCVLFATSFFLVVCVWAFAFRYSHFTMYLVIYFLCIFFHLLMKAKKKVHLRHFRSDRVWNSLDLAIRYEYSHFPLNTAKKKIHNFAMLLNSYSFMLLHRVWAPSNMIKSSDMNGSLGLNSSALKGKIGERWCGKPKVTGSCGMFLNL